MRTGSLAQRVALAVVALATTSALPASAFDLTGTWEVRSARCRGYGSSTSEPYPFKQTHDPGTSTAAISQTGADLRVSLPRAVVTFSADLFHGFALDQAKSSSDLTPIEGRVVGGLVACGGIPEDLMGASTRTELGSLTARQRGSRATLKLNVKSVRFGFESGMSAITNHVYECAYTLRRIDATDPAVPACP